MHPQLPKDVDTVPNLSERVQVMLTPASAATIKRLAKLQGRSRSAVVRDFLDEVAPVLDRTANLLELALKAQGKWPKDLVAKLERMQTGLEATALTHMDHLDMLMADGPAHRRSAGHGQRKPDSPPTTNRGVTTRKRTRTVQ